jgi:predicted kinase
MKPVLYLMCGLPGSGKTTTAKEIASKQAALRFNADEWILSIYGHELERPERDTVRDSIEALQWQTAKQALSLGCNVILDWGFWSRSERDQYRNEAEALGAEVKVIYLDFSIDELWQRISQRPESTKGTLHITKEELEKWATMFEAPNKDELS